MVDSVRNVLLAGLDDALLRRVVTALGSLRLNIHRGRSLAEVDERTGLSHFDVAVVAFTGGQSALTNTGELDACSRQGGRRPAMVVLCPGALLGDAASSLGSAIGRMVVLESLESELPNVISTMLGVAPRFQLRAPVQMSLAGPSEKDTWALGTTENISSSGMLVSSLHEMAVGSTIRFAIAVPGHDLMIRGSARVVRATDQVREGLQGIGARFVSFTGAGKDSLNDLLTRQVH